MSLLGMVARMGLLEKLLGKPYHEAPVDVGDLFDGSIKDTKDTRTIHEIPRLHEAIMNYQSPENVEKREIFTFDDEKRKAPDFYLPYYWVATYHFDKGNFDEAKKVLLEGIRKCNIKSVLCRRLGEFYFLRGDVDGALYWLFTTVLADTGSIDYHSCLYLAYTYEAYGMKKPSVWALRRARGISYKLLMEATEYSAKKKEKILGIAARNRSAGIEKKLAGFYGYAKRAVGDI
jgi:tetratricopeptide (TPR) repeat protein